MSFFCGHLYVTQMVQLKFMMFLQFRATKKGVLKLELSQSLTKPISPLCSSEQPTLRLQQPLADSNRFQLRVRSRQLGSVN